MHATSGLELAVRQGSLVDGDELVLVNASNTNGQLGTGVSGALRRACGVGFQSAILAALEADFHGPMPPGEVLITHAGTHERAKWVAHVAVMDYRNGFTAQSYPSLLLVREACMRLWGRLESIEGGPLSVAMVALGAGTGRLGLRDSTRAALETLHAHHAERRDSKIRKVVFYGYELHEFVVTAAVVAEFDASILDALEPEARSMVGALRGDRSA